MGLLDGKVAIITGAGGGIGRAHALAFAKEGAKVVVNDLGCDRSGGGEGAMMADTVVNEIKGMGGTAVANFDTVATSDGAKGLIRTAVNSFGKLDILVNNAGILRDKTFLKMEEAMWDVVIQVHLKGTFLCSQQAAFVMKEQGTGGRIINTTSFSGLIGNFGQANYGAAKAGIAGLTRVLALELQRAGITVNAIAPAAFTRMTADLPMFQGTEQSMAPECISPIVVYLASDLSKDVTGKIFGVQGGKIFAYVMTETAGINKENGLWSAEEIHKSFDRIFE